ncbi:hypothetical protein QFC24_000013 [Naganishia onofrii]|uniref:Uncharacterized protein n=1 Tax=Naganishia onofrii TaxID=1851511 RepID=A0ACC2XVS8_9TREE|nr:hypothetical protein QFC24_000013 [Naganishia onofrii]
MPEPISKAFRVVVVGGGIAGLAAGIALRGEGREVTVLEASGMNKEIGAAISLQPNAVKILQQWGVEDEFRKRGGAVDSGFQIFRTDGQLQMKIPFFTSQYGADRLCFHRVDLHDALKAVALSESLPGSPVNIRVSSRVKSCDCEKGIVRLDSGEEIQADLIIGADGIHSKIREAVLGEKKIAVPTGLSAYRLIIPAEKLFDIPHVSSMMTDKDPWTTMVVGHSCRAVMGPCRNQSLLSIVGLVPDEKMHEEASKTSWTESGSMEDLLASFEDFPPWLKDTFKTCPDLGLWQLRDFDPLPTWVKGRTILIGDAAHAMLPLQGQGASQSFEDAEALGTLFKGFSTTSLEETNAVLQEVFNARYERASLIQGYSRQAARPGTAVGSTKITMNPKEFMDYNCNYSGVEAWMANQN